MDDKPKNDEGFFAKLKRRKYVIALILGLMVLFLLSTGTLVLFYSRRDPGIASLPGRIVFVADYPTDKRTLSELYVVNADTSKLAKLPIGTAHVAWTTLSPDGKQLAFTLNRDGLRYQLYMMNTDGSEPVRLTNTEGVSEAAPSWSPDGKKIVYEEEADKREINVVSLDNPTPQRLTHESTQPSSPHWSPDGKYIAYSVQHLYIMNSDGSEKRRLTDLAVWNDMAWSPDSRQIAFLTQSNDGMLDLYTINVDGSNLKKVTSNLKVRGMAWSPNSRQIVVTCQKEGPDTDLYIVDADGSNLKQLTSGTNSDYQAVWTPDGSRIAFLSRRDDKARLFVMGSNGAFPHQLTDNKLDITNFVWMP